MARSSSEWAVRLAGGILFLATIAAGIFLGTYLIKSLTADYGTIAEFLLVIVLGIEGLLVLAELHRMDLEREHANVAAIIERVAEHNWQVTGDASGARRKVVGKLEHLNIPAKDDEESEYWAAREVHLSHLNLVWQVWELAGAPKRLPKRLDGWNHFAQQLVRHLRDAAVTNKTPQEKAAKDLWDGIDTYEVWPTRFVRWLKERAGK